MSEQWRPQYLRTLTLRATTANVVLVDEVLVALPPEAPAPVTGDAYEVPDLGRWPVNAVWPAGHQPESVKSLTYDTLEGFTIIKVRQPRVVGIED